VLTFPNFAPELGTGRITGAYSMATSGLTEESDNPLVDADDDDVYGKAMIDFEANETGEVNLRKGKLRYDLITNLLSPVPITIIAVLYRCALFRTLSCIMLHLLYTWLAGLVCLIVSHPHPHPFFPTTSNFVIAIIKSLLLWTLAIMITCTLILMPRRLNSPDNISYTLEMVV